MKAIQFKAPCEIAVVDLQEPALDARVLVHAGGGVGPVAGPQSDPAQEEVLFELLPFLR